MVYNRYQCSFLATSALLGRFTGSFYKLREVGNKQVGRLLPLADRLQLKANPLDSLEIKELKQSQSNQG